MSDQPLHKADSRRLSFGSLAGSYDEVRPRWPRATLEWLAGSPNGPIDILDLGCGTGIGAKELVEAGHRVTAVDVSAGMLEVLERWRAQQPADVAARLTVVEGSAEAIPLPDSSVDAVVVLQAWHWFDPEVAAREAARVLRPDGVLGLGWSRPDKSAAWHREMGEIVREPGDHMYAYATDVAEEPEEPEEFWVPGFGPFEMAELPNPLRQRLDDFVRHADSWSFVSTRTDRAAVLDRVRALGERIADKDGMLDFPHISECGRARVEVSK